MVRIGVFLLIAIIAIMAVTATSIASENAIENVTNQPQSVAEVPALAPVVVEAASSKTYRRTLLVLWTPRVIHEARTARRITRQTAKTDIESTTTAPGRVYIGRRSGMLGIRSLVTRTGPAPDH